MKGLIANIFTNPIFHRCSIGGISQFLTEVTVVGPDIDEVFSVTPERPAVTKIEVVKGHFAYVPVEFQTNWQGRLMHGGAFVYGGDSRLPSTPLPLFDRSESGPIFEIDYCRPLEISNSSSVGEVNTKIGALLDALDEIDGSIISGPIVKDVKVFRHRIVTNLRAQGGSISSEGGGSLARSN